MIGLVLTLLYSGWQYLHGIPVGMFYPAATNFLFWWYVVMAVIVGVFYIGVTLLLSLGLMASGAESGGIVGGLLGLTIGGGAVTLILLVSYLLNFGCLLVGTVLLQSAYVGDHWDAVRVVFGGLLVIVGILMGSFRTGSSSSSKKK